MKTISVVVPVYYNAKSLDPLFQELQKVEASLAERECALELIFVDDGSGDDSFDKLLKIKAQRQATRVVKLARNFGAMESSKLGLRYVNGDAFMWLSADLQDPPEYIPIMVDHWLAGSKFVVYARAARQDPLLTRFFAGFYYWLLEKLVVKGYPRGGYDLALMDKAMLEPIRDSGKNVNYMLLAYWLGFTPHITYYTRVERAYGKSRWRFAKKLKLFADSFLGFSAIPIRLITLVGLVVSLLSFTYGAVILVYALFGVRDVAGFSTLVTLITFLLGLIILMLGIIGEYILRIYDQVSGRPEAVIETVL